MPTSPEEKLGPVARRLAATERVLCVEDEPDIATFLRAYFRASGYDLVHIDPRSADEVLDALDEHQPDIVLLDLRLHGFSGIDAYRMMRADDRWAFTPVVMVSGIAESDPTFERPTGLDTIVSKPFNTNTLAGVVRDRIDEAKQLAATGRSSAIGVLSEDYLTRRIRDEIALGTGNEPFSFALIQLRSIAEIRAEVGEEGLDFLAMSLLADAGKVLPAETVIGITANEEIAVLLPGMKPREAFSTMRDILERANGTFTFAGGAQVPVDLACGMAAYPANATDADELIMAADAALADAIDAKAVIHLAL